MFASFIFFCFAFYLEVVLSRGNSSCLHITLYDTFGGNWRNAKFVLEKASEKVMYTSPHASSNPFHSKNCHEHGPGHYYMTISKPRPEPLLAAWEV
jgi:hypothetical protein